MKIYFMRHGLAVQRGSPGYQDDSERPLTDVGRKKLLAVCGGLDHLEPDWDLIVSSPYVRAKQTAEVVAEYFGMSHLVQESEVLIPGHTLHALSSFLSSLVPVRSLLLVGHEPLLSQNISAYIFGSPHGRILMKKAGVACLEFENDIQENQGALLWLMGPSQLQRLGKKRR